MAGATILFCDLVGFSQHNNAEQRDLIYSLNAEVAHELYADFSELSPQPTLIGLPTGDGMALALLDQPRSWAPALFSLLYRLMRWAAQNNKIRIGVHVGPVSVISDINRRPNVCGATINDSQRVMDAAHPNQVLFSDIAYRQYVGPQSLHYAGPPFSQSNPAKFAGPYNIIGKHDLTIPVRIMYRDDETIWNVTEPYPRGAIVGKLARTQFIIDQLARLLRHKQTEITIYEQSAFSTFGNSSDEDLWRKQPEYSEEYLQAQLRQRELLDRLTREKRTRFKLIVHPFRAYDQVLVHARLTSLLAWMRSPDIRRNEKIEFVIGKYKGPNRLIVLGDFCLEGFKLHDTSGYELSMVHNDQHSVSDAMAAFDDSFSQAKSAGYTKERVIRELDARRRESAPKIPARSSVRKRRARSWSASA